jgi:hypothetical protein
MSKFVEKIPAITGIALVLISVLVVLLVYVGGDADPMLNAAGEEMAVPKFTDSILYWTYLLFAVSVLITIVGALASFIKGLIESPKTALKTLLPIIGFILIFVIAWNLGTGDRLAIIGYEGTENEGSWAKFTDMVLYSTYALFVLVIAAIIGARVNDSLK